MGKCTQYATECKRGCNGICAAENSFRPSNGTEGMDWMEDFCSQCIHDNPYLDDPEKKYMGKRSCELITNAMCFYPTDPEYPKEWVYQAGKPVCTKFFKWDWGNDGDPDDPNNPKRPPDPPNPAQLHLFPLYPSEITYQPQPQKQLA